MYKYLLVITITTFKMFKDTIGFIKLSESLPPAPTVPVLLTLIFYIVLCNKRQATRVWLDPKVVSLYSVE
jgi:hypothetical protein